MVALPSLNSKIRDIDCDCNCCITIPSFGERSHLLSDKPQISQELLDQVVVLVDPENQKLHLARKPGLLRRQVTKGAAKRHAERMGDVFRRYGEGSFTPSNKRRDFMTLREYQVAKQEALTKKARREHAGQVARLQDIDDAEFEEMWQVTQI